MTNTSTATAVTTDPRRLYLHEALVILFWINFTFYTLVGQLPTPTTNFLLSATLLSGVCFSLTGRELRESLSVYGLPLLILTVLNAGFTTYDILMWSGDWYEHYLRALVYIRQWNVHDSSLFSPSIPTWAFHVRPPVANVLAAVGLQLTSQHFWNYQLLATILNALPFLGMVHLVKALSGGGTIRSVALVSIAMSPSLAFNALYPWTRGLTTYFLLCGAALLVNAASGRTSLTRAILPLAAATLTHYSAVPYAMVLGVIGAVAVRRRAAGWLDLTSATLLVLVLISPWVLWIFATFGTQSIFADNGTVVWRHSLNFVEHVMRIFVNGFCSFVPLMSIIRLFDPGFVDLSTRIQFFSFTFYQQTIPGFLGLSGLYLLWISSREGKIRYPQWTRVWIVILILAAVSLNANFSPFGLAHITLQPIAAACLAYLFVDNWNNSKVLRTAIKLRAVDLLLGIGVALAGQGWLSDSKVESECTGPHGLHFINHVLRCPR